jgi:RsiW-degrading membrane proteinase PrsW (M82 family)
MALSVKCPACGTGHKAPERAAGKTLACLACRSPMTVPSPEPLDPAAILLQDDEPSPSPFSTSTEEPAPESAPNQPRARKKTKTRDLASLPPLTTNDLPFWRRHLHWLLILALTPLIVSLLTEPDKAQLEDRIQESLDEATPEDKERIIQSLRRAESLDEVVNAFPGQRLPGAFLSRSTLAHYLMALLAIVLYMTFFMYLASDGSARPVQVLLVGLFTSTIGVGFLLLVQLIASATEGRIVVGANIVALIFLIFKFIAYSYSAALNTENGFFLSFLGFTFGVGLCEEFVKFFPLLWQRSSLGDRTWRYMLIWGMASGAGFGIAEGIIYSDRYYNGIASADMYLVRFLSCVALHAIWSGSAGVLFYIRRDLFENIETWHGWIFPVIFVIGIPVILHGLYDTSLKKDMNGLALLVAFASFGYLAFLFSRLQTADDEAATKAMLREYKRRKAAMKES